ncbi:hypothetical protein ACRALDRAFT_1067323 [Sodiomyces alcalophilus JCM 7366]|uniref:uncharacterized protein n=1 Tax=Sodiomyces alcalophilus JCM 7366 TaxID=591952 RepID=UPI0039B6235C
MVSRNLLLSVFYASLAATTATFDVREATIDSIHNALFTRLTTCRHVVSSYIARIEALNPSLHAVISLNPDALSIADDMDNQIAFSNATGPLFCIPILLKDNFDAVGMPTTSGARPLADLYPLVDAPTVTALKRAGGLILGKANMHEMALEGLSVSSLGGQIVNPYDLARTPGGSSGGTGVAVAANLAVFGTGSDTVNSLRSPASANNLFSFRPTRGLISRAGVIPNSYSHDTVGAMARSLDDLAVALTVMASVGYDPADNTTAFIPPEVLGRDYRSALYGGNLKGKRLGLVQGLHNYEASNETTPVNEAMAHMVALLQGAGAHVVNVTSPLYNATAIISKMDLQQLEYRELLDEYLARDDLEGDFPRSFYEFYGRDDFLVIPAQYGYIETAWTGSTANATYFERQRLVQNLTLNLHSTFRELELDALIYPQQKNLVVPIGSPSQAGRNGILAALTGVPVVMVPAGFSPPTETAPLGVPIGMEIMGLPWTEDKLLNIARHLSGIAQLRRMPVFANASVEVTSPYASVPTISLDAGSISPNYPLGEFGRGRKC